MSSMKTIKVEKVTLNCGCGTDFSRLEKSMKLLKAITKTDPVKTSTQCRIPTWGLRKGLQVGTKVTLRGDQAATVLKRMLEAKENILKASSFDNNGNVAFGIHECIDIPGVEYDPDIGIIGLQITVTLERPGFRIKRRSIRKKHIPIRHRISKEDALAFGKDSWGIKLKEEEESGDEE
ncbi:MAG: large subunit ribosomal protein L5 [Candidatus Woesearchaeota archaeon]|jgi:large subunit ribosomal protein L5